jgi:zinc transport system ATP-binding protein
VDVLSDVSLGIERGSVTAIIGPNGAGKTTLLRAILGLVPYGGRIRFLDRTGNVKSERPRIGYVPQRLDFDRGVPMTVLELLAMSHQRRPVWLGVSRRSRQAAQEQLRRVEAEHLIDRKLGRVSGGEFQRVQLALALQLDPEIVLLDEPVSGVDVAGESLFCDILAQVQQQSHLTLVMVSHDLSVVSSHATHVVCLNRTLLAAGPVRQVLTTDMLSQAFGPHTSIGDLKGLTAHSHGPGCGR